jgi:hypothetical protein
MPLRKIETIKGGRAWKPAPTTNKILLYYLYIIDQLYKSKNILAGAFASIPAYKKTYVIL